MIVRDEIPVLRAAPEPLPASHFTNLDFYVFFYQLSFNVANLYLIYRNFKFNVIVLCFNVHSTIYKIVFV